jgi:hypothetical protein
MEGLRRHRLSSNLIKSRSKILFARIDKIIARMKRKCPILHKTYEIFDIIYRIIKRSVNTKYSVQLAKFLGGFITNCDVIMCLDLLDVSQTVRTNIPNSVFVDRHSIYINLFKYVWMIQYGILIR